MKNTTLMAFKALSMIFLISLFSISCNTDTKSNKGMDEKVEEAAPDFQISLAQWSLNKSFFGEGERDWVTFGRRLREAPDSLLQGKLHPDNFPEIAAGYGIDVIELVNTFYFGKADDMEYWKGFKKKCEDAGVSVGLIMCDALGDLGHSDPVERQKTIENHHKWVDIAALLGAHTIRVNAAGQGTAEEVANNAVLGLSKLGEYGASKGINIVVENHGGYSSDGSWLSGVMKAVDKENVGTLPDFGNFCIERGEGYTCTKEYDRYKGMEELMPYAKGVSAKAHDFDENGNETGSDFVRIMKIVKESGFRGHVGIEYEGSNLSEDEGIKKTKALLEKVFAEI